MQSSYVELHQGGGVSFVGPDAVNLMRAITLRRALELYARTGMLLARGVSPTQLLKIAQEYTGKAYKRGQYDQAAQDVGTWVEAMKAAMPISEEGQA